MRRHARRESIEEFQPGGPFADCLLKVPLPPFPQAQVLPPGPAATVAAETEEEVQLAPLAAGTSPERLSQGERRQGGSGLLANAGRFGGAGQGVAA